MVLVGSRPEENGDERRRTWEEGVGRGGDDEDERKEASLDALVAERAAGLSHNAPALMLKQRRAAVLRARAKRGRLGRLGREQNEAGRGLILQAHFYFVHG